MKKKMIGIILCLVMTLAALNSVSYAQIASKKTSALFQNPYVEITSPEDGAEVTNPYIVVEGYAASEIYMNYWEWLWEWEDGSQTGGEEIDPVGYYQFSIDIEPLAVGENTITVTFYDVEGGYGSDDVTIYFTEECNHGTPRITDGTGNTKFYGIFIGCNYSGSEHELKGAENAANAMYETLKGKTGWAESRMKKLTGDDATRTNIRSWINKFKDDPDEDPPNPQPNDEFLFFFSGHGNNQTVDKNDETDDYDETILANDSQDITDDDLCGWLSGFPKCVTITVKLDACHSGGFKDGTQDVQHAEDADWDEYGPNKINIEAACGANEEEYEYPYFWEDTNGDGIATPDEYVRKLKVPASCDENDNGEQDPGETWYWWNDKNNDKVVDPDEHVPWNSSNASFMTNFTYNQLEALEEESKLFGGGYLKGDRNKDGIITTREWYEYAIKHIYEASEGDNDGDGLVDEDDGEYDISSGFKVKIYIDNDGDDYINEDPGTPSSAFWPNEHPDKPNTPAGPSSGKPKKTYTYRSETEDADLDDVFYLFDWGDGTNSGWLGPYTSGVECTSQHSWSKQGDYQIKVKARDRLYAESPWSDSLTVTMPRSRAVNPLLIQFLEKLLEQFPLLQWILTV